MTLALLLLSSCSSDDGTPKSTVEAAFQVTIGVDDRQCEVAVPQRRLRQTMSCDEVAPFASNNLKFPRGTYFKLETIPDIRENDFDEFMSSMGSNGYTLTPGVHVGFLNEPHGSRSHSSERNGAPASKSREQD
jgi:hypothetical protein